MGRVKAVVLCMVTLLLEKDANVALATLCSPTEGVNSKVFHIPENSPNGTLVGSVGVEGNARIGDGQTINLYFDVSYLAPTNKCGRTCNSWLTLDPSSQDITLSLNEGEFLNRDGKDGIKRLDVKIVCHVISGEDAESHSDVYITVYVDDVNDNSPKFSSDNYVISVNELTPPNSRLLTVTASDEDEISSIKYSIVVSSKPGYFAIPDEAAGDIVLLQNLDYEALKAESTEIWLNVEAKDKEADGTSSAVARVTVTVVDGDDQAPIFQSCVQIGRDCVSTEYSGQLATSVAPGAAISNLAPGPIFAVDPDVDLPTTTSVSYSLHADASDYFDAVNHFTISETSGVVYLDSALPSPLTVSKISMYIKATQSNDPSKFSFTKLTISIVDDTEVSHADVFTPKNSKGHIHKQAADMVLTLGDDSSLLHLVADEQAYPKSELLSPLEFKLLTASALFEVTSDGYIVCKKRECPDESSLPITLHLQVRNKKGKSDAAQGSDVGNIATEFRSDNAACSEMGCSDGPNGSFIAGIAVTSAFLLVTIVTIVILAVVMQKLRQKATKRKSLEGFQNHFAHKLADGMASHHSSASSSVDKCKEDGGRSHRSQLSSIHISNNTTSPSPTRDRTHRAQNGGRATRYHANGRANEDSPSIAPFHSFNGADATHGNQAFVAVSNLGWERFEIPAFIEYHQLSVDHELYRAQHKRVHRGLLTMQDGHVTKCLVKVYSNSFPNKRHLSGDFTAMNEVLNVRSCTQINLVKFFGCCLYSDSLYVISEYATSTTDLRSALRSSRMCEPRSVLSSFSGSQLSNFAFAIADGLRYLHGHDVAHGCVCTSQILFTDHMVPKLKGCCGRTNFRLRKQKCLRWAAPEVVTNKEYLLASDVWSYAVVVWEIATLGGLPYPTVPEKCLKYNIQSFGSGDAPFEPCRNVVRRMWTILQSCWEINPTHRPTISDVCKKWAKLRNSVTPIFVSTTPGYEYAPTTVVQRQ